MHTAMFSGYKNIIPWKSIKAYWYPKMAIFIYAIYITSKIKAISYKKRKRGAITWT